ncbi:hypothetical protein E2C01_068026 [Portunus trituberculatus]|uniref:Uncharacterized protein n=1 Tax=Portunus trituberculatus TaxID=210409 RepID=A0A5B7HMN1_PORTR|nr:hypothetical protein [Portunus trituberculatus]
MQKLFTTIPIPPPYHYHHRTQMRRSCGAAIWSVRDAQLPRPLSRRRPLHVGGTAEEGASSVGGSAQCTTKPRPMRGLPRHAEVK